MIDGASADETPLDATDPLGAAWVRRAAGLPDGFDGRGVLAVRGNHDVFDPTGFYAAADDLSDGRLVRVASGLWVGGIGWRGGRYFDLPGEGDLQTPCDALRRAVRRQVMPGERLVLVTHYPPALAPLPTVPEAGAYFWKIAELVRDLQPAAVVAGHMHAWAGTAAACRWAGGQTLLVMPGARGMLLGVGETVDARAL